MVATQFIIAEAQLGKVEQVAQFRWDRTVQSIAPKSQMREVGEVSQFGVGSDHSVHYPGGPTW